MTPLMLMMALACKGGDDTPSDDTAAVDADGDGFNADDDCNDDDAAINPDAAETCNSVDDNCDGSVDEGVTLTWYADLDDDGYGDDASSGESCEVPANASAEGGDCDDADASINPGAAELCDGVDQDCDSAVDEDATDAITGWSDADGDGYGDPATEDLYCPGDGVVEQGEDCDDADPALNPAATEICGDGIDNNCDGEAGICEWEGVNDVSDVAQASIAGLSAGDELGAPVRALDLMGDGSVTLGVSARNAANGAGDAAAGVIYLLDGSFAGSLDVASATAAIEGAAADDGLYNLQGPGDVDGDGHNDLFVAARTSDTAFANGGEVYVMAGPFSGTTSVSSAIATYTGEADADKAGVVVPVGDVNGDGQIDMLVAAQNNDINGNNSGKAYLVYGPFSGANSLANADAIFEGSSGSLTGGGLSGAGDLNGDGDGDFLIGAPKAGDGGEVYVVNGDAHSGTSAAADAGIIISGAATGDEAGWGLAQAGDHDGDGYNDLLVSAQRNDDGGNNAGAVYLLTGPFDADRSLADAGIRILGSAEDDRVSNSNGLTDFNGDGSTDVIIGTRFHDGAAGADAGGAFVFYGPLGDGSYAIGSADATFEGSAAGDGFGNPVVRAGDVDGDNIDDILVGARWADGVGVDSGAAYLILGSGL